MRRDLTINALFYDMGRGEIVDLVGGIADLKKKKIRTVGVPEQRFDEDPLRKLRAVRFAGSVGGRMDKDTWNALRKNPDISGISKERIRDEFIKGIKKSKSVPNYFKMLSKLGMFKQIFPGLRVNALTSNKTNNYKLQIADMLYTNGADKVKRKLNSLKYTNQEVNDIWFLIVISLPTWPIDNLHMIKNLQKNVKLSTSDIKEWAKMWGTSGKKILKIWNWKLSVSSRDAMKQGLRGKDIGDYVRDKEYELFTSS
tara:strand:- start:8083 stop:8847 length:765 start_codon:yes stop_codon:yes gene_type:complete